MQTCTKSQVRNQRNPLSGVPGTQEERHHGGYDPEENQNVTGPYRPQWRVQVVVIVGVKACANGGKQEGKADQTPHALAEGPGVACDAPADYGGDQRSRGVNPVAPQGGSAGAVPEHQYCAVHR